MKPFLEVDESEDDSFTVELAGVEPKDNLDVDCIKLVDGGVDDVELAGKGDVKVTVVIGGVCPEAILVVNVVVDSVDVKCVDVDVDVQGFCVGFRLFVELPSEENILLW